MDAGARGRAVRAEAAVAAWLRSAPGTYVYLFTLLVTAWSMRGLEPHVADHLIRAQSTNLDNLTERPVQVLVSSAFWTTGSGLPWQLVPLFTVVLAPVERRLGTRRWLTIFVAGHVVATLITVAGISIGLRHGLLADSQARTADVGVSYGLYAVAGALTWLLVGGRWRCAWAALLLVSVGVPAAVTVSWTYTDAGHLISLAVGLAFAPLVRRWQRSPVPRAALGGRPLIVPTAALTRFVPGRLVGERRGQVDPPATTRVPTSIRR